MRPLASLVALLLLLLPLCAADRRERSALRRGALYPLKRGNSAEPPGLVPTRQLVPTAESSYVMDLHPLARKSGSKPGTPCGLTSKVLGDLYGARKLDLVMDKGGSAAAPPPLNDGGNSGVEGQDCIGEDQQLREGDKGSGLIWLLGDPATQPPAGEAGAGGDALG